MRLGAHVSTAGGMRNAIEASEALSCDAIQVFTRNQRQWVPRPLDPEDAAFFKKHAPVAVSHASYLMMLGANVLTIKRLLGHSTLAELDTYAELCEEYLMGDARPLQRQMLLLLCPDLPDAVLDRILPSRRSLLASLSGQSVSRVQSLQAVIPMEDVLFSGLVYQVPGQGVSQGDGSSVFFKTF